MSWFTPPFARLWLVSALWSGFVGRYAVGAEAEAAQPPVDFAKDVQPLLKQRCWRCHGGDHQEGGLRLNERKSAFAGGDSGKPAIVPGKPDDSRLVRAVSGREGDLKMPPEDEGPPLSEQQVNMLSRWIAAGAPWPEQAEGLGTRSTHWAWRKPKAAPLPAVSRLDWPRNEIDFFVLARLEQEKLPPAAEADRATLMRRVSLDLVGLPPSPQEVDAYLADVDPAAYERFVERLLASPAFGERWARVWLDLARYADSKGYGADPLRVIWRYRDWVVHALNVNLPYDRFTIEQLAGDLLPDCTNEQLLATAFNRNSMSNNEGGVDDAEFRLVSVRDRLETTVQIWMGLTIGCAKCHSHKFDPITQREYYQCLAFLDQTEDANRIDEEPKLRVPTAAEQQEIDRITAAIARLKASADIETDAAKRAERARLNAQFEELNRRIVATPIMRELPADKRRATHVLVKGSYLSPGEQVEPGVPAAFHPLPDGAAANRLGFARWLVDRENPLTARVAVNRMWSQLWGTGLVASEEDFGTQGTPPSHPELLDWLAVDFMRDWNLKRSLKKMVTSAAYRQSSAITPELAVKDPGNQLLARGARFRLEAEMIRDQALSLGGLLSRKMGGPPVFPPQPPALWRFTDLTQWQTSPGEDRYRRALYTFWRRQVPHPSMVIFDAPSREVCSLRRRSTNTPLQALVMLNDPVFVEAAQSLARRVVREGGASANERVAYALRLCLVRQARPEQLETLLRLYQSEREHYAARASEAQQVATDPLGPLPEGFDAAELAAWTVVAATMLNHDGLLTRN